MIKIGMTPKEDAAVQVFQSCGIYPISRGSTSFRSGAILGIPLTFEAKTYEDLLGENIKHPYSGKKFTGESKREKIMLDSMLLSRKAKVFAIARELAYLGTLHQHIEFW